MTKTCYVCHKEFSLIDGKLDYETVTLLNQEKNWPITVLVHLGQCKDTLIEDNNSVLYYTKN